MEVAGFGVCNVAHATGADTPVAINCIAQSRCSKFLQQAQGTMLRELGILVLHHASCADVPVAVGGVTQR